MLFVGKSVEPLRNFGLKVEFRAKLRAPVLWVQGVGGCGADGRMSLLSRLTNELATEINEAFTVLWNRVMGMGFVCGRSE